jgi:hypothetical protein
MKFTRTTPARTRLLARLYPQSNGCWYWGGVIDGKGYGRVGYKGRKSETLQRAVYDCLVGPIPSGIDVDHRCHTEDESCQGGTSCMHRRCGNPEHLELVDRAENTRRGRSFSSVNRKKTCCPQGHPYDEANTYVSKGRRYCVACYTTRHGRPPVRRSA